MYLYNMVMSCKYCWMCVLSGIYRILPRIECVWGEGLCDLRVSVNLFEITRSAPYLLF